MSRGVSILSCNDQRHERQPVDIRSFDTRETRTIPTTRTKGYNHVEHVWTTRDVDTNNNTNHHKRVGALAPMPSCLGIKALQWVPGRTPTVHWGCYDGRLWVARPQATTPRGTTRTQTSLESIVSGETCAVLLST